MGAAKQARSILALRVPAELCQMRSEHLSADADTVLARIYEPSQVLNASKIVPSRTPDC